MTNKSKDEFIEKISGLTLTTSDKKDILDDNILFEDVTKRSEKAKHFKTKDGEYVAAIYDEPIHTFDEATGKYIEFADSLKEDDNCYELTAGKFKARFPKEDDDSHFVEIERNGKCIGWHIQSNSARRNKASVFKKERKNKTSRREFPRFKYEDGENNIALEYDVTGDGVKENIILNSRPVDNSFKFDLNLNGLLAVLSGDKKTVTIYDKDNDAVPDFILPKINMTDAAGVYSEDAHYEITKEKGNTTLEIVVSPEWLYAEERVYPITIDPQVMVYYAPKGANSVTTVKSNGAKVTSGSTRTVGYDENGTESRTFMKFNFPDLPDGAKPISAQVNLFQAQFTGSIEYNVCKITEDWNSSTISWSNQPNYNCACLCDTFESRASGSSHTVILDVSAPVLNCYRNGTTDYGLAIVPAEGSCVLCQNGNTTVFEEEFIEFDSAPIAFVKYMLVDDYVSHQKAESFETGRAGTGTVNLFTGKLNFVHNDIVEPDGNLPFTLSHIYRSELTTTSDDNTFGKGWRLSALQTIESTMINTTLDTVYIDSLGRRHYFTDFYRDASGNEIYYDTAGLGLMYSQYNNEITDEKGNKLTFENGKLKKIITAYGEYVNTYNAAGQLLTVTNSVGKNITLSYNSAGRLNTIKDANNRCTSYLYDSYGNLTQITYPDGSKTKYSYDSASRLIKVTNQDVSEYVITYESSGNDRRVTGITEKGKNSANVMVSGGGIDIEYQAFSAVVQNKITKMRTVYRFDDIGRMRYSYEDTSLTNLAKDGITATDLREYEVLCNSQGTETAGRYASVKAAITGTEKMHDNYLTNGSFDSSTAGNALPAYWIMGADYTGTDGVITTDGYASDYNSFKFNNTCCRSKKSIQQSVNMRNEDINGNMLVASAWAKASNPVNTHGDSDATNAKFELYAKVTYVDGTELSRTEMFDYGCTDWQYVAIPLEIPSADNPPAVVTVKFNFSGNTGTCLLSNVRLTSTRGTYTKIDYGYTETYTEQFSENLNRETIVKRIVRHDGIKYEHTFYNVASDAVKTRIFCDGTWFDSFVKYDDSHRPVEAKDYRNMITKYYYDSYGNQIRQTTHPMSDTRKSKQERVSKDEYGKVIRAYDPRNNSYYTEYEYNSNDGMLAKETDANQQIYSHIYDSNKRQTSFAAVNANGSYTNIANNTTYNNDRVSSLGHNTTSYNYTYDPFGRTSEIKIAGSTLLSLTHVDSTTSSVTSNYENGNTVEVISDAHGNPTSKIINDTIVSVAEYDARGHIIELLDNRKNVCYNYTYDDRGNLATVDETSGTATVNCLSYTYDDENRLIARNESVTGFTYNTLYEKRLPSADRYIYPDDCVLGIELDGKYSDAVELNDIRQPYMRRLTLASSDPALIIEHNDYLSGASGNYTDFISKVDQTVGGNTYTTQYTYDFMGNIASYTIGENTVSYAYDTIGRLTSESNEITGRITSYFYDDGGNITSKYVYNSEQTLLEYYIYTYDTVWKDKLLSITKTDVATNTATTETITYDDSVNILGNPKTYRGNDLTWTDVRRLASYGSNTFSYGADGIRYKKNNITYTLDGSRILKESGARNITYYYGLSGVIGFRYGGTDYYYRKNIQGDVIAIHNANGTLVASYAYDAWGKCTILSGGDSANSIANINPFRYRSYYYDTETGLYYLETRYYDPEIGRFISADSIEYLDPETIGGLNLFAYCNNNPVMGYDPTGHLDWNRIGKAVMIVSVVAAAVAISVATYGAGSGMALVLSAAAIGAGAELFDQAVIENKALDEVNWGKVGIAGLAEGVAAAYCPFSIWCNALVSAGVSFLGNNLIGETESIGNLLYDITAGCIGGYALDFLGKRLSKLPKKVFGIEYTNYSTYQRALRENGYMFPRAEVKQMMHNASTFRSIRNDIVNNTAAFSSGIFWVLLKMKLN